MPNSEVPYGILRIKADQKYTRVSLPSDEFIFFSDNEQKGRIFNDGVFKSYDQIGNVTVTAQDVAIDSNKAQGLVYIVPPDQLEVELYDVTQRVSSLGVDEYAEMIYGSNSDQELNFVKKGKNELD